MGKKGGTPDDGYNLGAVNFFATRFDQDSNSRQIKATEPLAAIEVVGFPADAFFPRFSAESDDVRMEGRAGRHAYRCA